MSREKNEEEMRLDPWGVSFVKDYNRLMEEFGIKSIKPLVNIFPQAHRLLRRGIIFGHRDVEIILDAIKKGEEYAVMSGIKPSGDFHLGSKLTAEELIFFQKLSPKATAFYAICNCRLRSLC